MEAYLHPVAIDRINGTSCPLDSRDSTWTDSRVDHGSVLREEGLADLIAQGGGPEISITIVVTVS